MELLVAFIVGILLGGGVVCFVMHHRRPEIVGELMIDYSDPDGPYPFMALNSSFSVIENSDRITLRVQKTNLLSRK